MIEREDYESEIKLLKAKVQDDDAVDGVISKGKIGELIKLMDHYWTLFDVMWKNVPGPAAYGSIRKREQIEIDKAILGGMNDWLKTEVWVLNDNLEVTDSL